jgi:hypothetical protein
MFALDAQGDIWWGANRPGGVISIEWAKVRSERK